MNYHSRVPLTAVELARRAAVLEANGKACALARTPADTGQDEVETYPHKNLEEFSNAPSDERQYGKMAAQILLDAQRSVALASGDARFGVFQQAAATLAEAVAGQWLPKNVIVDRLYEIATAHSFFGRDRHDVEETIGECSAKIRAPITSVLSPPLSSSPVPHHKSRLEVVCMADVKPSAIDWLWANWIAIGKVHVLAGERTPNRLRTCRPALVAGATVTHRKSKRGNADG